MHSTNDIINSLRSGCVGVLPTDTLYGLVGQALSPTVVEKIYNLRKRSPNKPLIILISSIEDLEMFNIELSQNESSILKNLWPNPVTVVLPCNNKSFEYLHRGTKSLAFRIPKNHLLSNILKKTGPLVAPSVNIEGEKPAETIKEAKMYFGDLIDFYFDYGKLSSPPSTIIKIEKGNIEIIRQGIFSLNKLMV